MARRREAAEAIERTDPRSVRRAEQQDEINAIGASMRGADPVGWYRYAALIRGFAYASVAEHTQYAGHWDGAEWRVVRVRRTVKTKLGVAFKVGDVTIAKRGGSAADVAGNFDTAYSLRNGADTSVRAGDLTVLFRPEAGR
jgi:hypothetical protein